MTHILAISVFRISVLEDVFKQVLVIFRDGYSPLCPLHEPVGMDFCSLSRHFGECMHGEIFCFVFKLWSEYFSSCSMINTS